jgi:putative iron-regulated protein
MIQDIQGVQNVYLGTYGSQEGPGIKDVIAELNSNLANRLEDEIAASLAAANALQPPFDQEIISGNDAGRARVQALIDALRTQEATLEEAFIEFGLDVPVAE